MGLEEENAPTLHGLYSTTSPIFGLVGGNYAGKVEAKVELAF
jgi:hypothetical protein